MKAKDKVLISIIIGLFLTRLININELSNQVYVEPHLQQDETVRFVVVGDSRSSDSDPGVNTIILAEIAQATINEGADFILFPGDLVYGNSSTQSQFEMQLLTWRDTMQPVYDANIGVYPVRGNHELNGNASWSKVAWDNVFSGDYALPANGPSGEENITYSFTYSNIFIVGLDQYTVSYHRVNQTWLDSQFALNVQPHVFVFGHTPAFKVLHTGCLDDYPSNRDVFWNSIEAEGGRTYFAGHDHFYDHARLDDGDSDPDNDLHQYVIGTAGAPLYGDGVYDGINGSWTPLRIFHEQEYGYVLGEIDGPNATLTWKHRTSPGVYEATDDVFTYTVYIEPPDPPAAPSALTATAISAERIDLVWTDNSNNENSFEIERSTKGSGGPFSMLETVGANTTAYQDTGLNAESEYCYRVRAINAGGQSDYTAAACAITLPDAPSAPSALTATAISAERIDLVWTDNSNNENGFEIERSTEGSGGPFSLLETVGANTTAYQDTGLKAESEYCYRVRAINAGGQSDYTAAACATTEPFLIYFPLVFSRYSDAPDASSGNAITLTKLDSK